ncbi:MAG: flagellar basal body rod protein FlgB [Gemmatimonadota bacterium]|nr:MAG: flagellar basal body rod protein FlgB [Gemmatimonadota bacterium]
MLKDILFSNDTLRATKAALDVYSERGRVHAGNIANAETPGYRSQEVRFEDDLKMALQTSKGGRMAQTDARHLGGSTEMPKGYRAYRNPESAWNSNGENDVDIDREMADVARNTLRYTVAAEKVRQAYQGMRKAIHGRPV